MTNNSPNTGVSSVPVIVLSANSCWNMVHFRSRLVVSLVKNGFHVVVLAPTDATAADLSKCGVEVRQLPIGRSSLNPLADARLLFRYFKLLRLRRPAVFCGFTVKPNIYGGLAARLCRIPTIANVSGLGTAFLTGGALWWLATTLYRASLRGSHTVFFHNRHDLETFVNNGIVATDQAAILPGSGVDLEHFAPGQATGTKPDAPIFLFVGRLLRDKGVREFVDAARMLRETMPGARFQLLGSMDPGNRTSINEAELGAWLTEGVVEHLGGHDDVRPFIRSATAVVLPSYREGMSRALLEAAAMGKPLVGSDVPGSRELVEEGVTGASCRPRDSGSLAKAMERIALAPAETLQTLGTNARQKVEREFNEDIVVRAYLDVLREITNWPSR